MPFSCPNRLQRFRTNIALNQVDPVHGQVQSIVAGIFQKQKIAGDVIKHQVLQPTIDAHTEIHMHHAVARLQLLQGNEDLFLAKIGNLPALEPFAEHLFLGDDRQAALREAETPGQSALQQGNRMRRPCQTFGKGIVGYRQRHIVVGQEVMKPLHLAALVTNEQNTRLFVQPGPAAIGQGAQHSFTFWGQGDAQILVAFRNNGERRRLLVAFRKLQDRQGQLSVFLPQCMQ